MRNHFVSGSTQELSTLQAIIDKANAYPQAGAPASIGAAFAAQGVTDDFATTIKNGDGSAFAWTKHHRDPEPVTPGSAAAYKLDVASIIAPTAAEIPDPTELAAEQAAVASRRAMLTAQERATVDRALDGAQPSRIL